MEDASLPALVARVVVSLGVVLAVMAAAAAVLRRSGVGATGLRRAPARVELLARHALGRNSSVAVVRLGERALVLGVTETHVTLLGEADPEELAPPPEEGKIPPAPGTAPAQAWKAVIEALRERTVRRS